MNRILSVIFLVSVCLFCLSISSCSLEYSIPNGWRLPTINDYPEYLVEEYGSILPIEVVADFNGDGQKDKASYLINEKENTEDLFIFWSFGTNNQKIERLAPNDFNSKIYFGISIVEPGIHKTACGLGYYECEPDEPTEIKLTYPGIGYFMIGSAFSVFYWNDTNDNLSHIWLSD